MKLLEYIKYHWYAFGIIIFIIGAAFFIVSENKKDDKYENCKCGEVMYLKVADMRVGITSIITELEKHKIQKK